MKRSISFPFALMISTLILLASIVILLILQTNFISIHSYDVRFIELAAYHRTYSAFLASTVEIGEYRLPIYDYINLYMNDQMNPDEYGQFLTKISYEEFKKTLINVLDKYKDNGILLGILIKPGDVIGYCPRDTTFRFQVGEHYIFVCEPVFITPTPILAGNS